MSRLNAQITSLEVAELLGVDRATVNRRARAGELPVVAKLPGKTGAFLFDRATIEQHKAALAEGGDAA
jgi:excisionase family DNA binding protein